MKKFLLLALMASTAQAVQINVSLPANQLPVCPAGDPGQYVMQGASLVCIASGSGPVVVAPSSCSVTQAPNTTTNPIQPGAGVTLSMACASGSPVTACSWNGVASSSCNLVVNPLVTTSYTVIASNSAGSSPSATTTVRVNASVSYCKTGDIQVNVPWPAGGQIRPQTSGFGQQIASFKLTVPATFNPPLNINHLGFVHMAEVPGTPTTTREFTVSKNACDMQSGNYIYNGMGPAATSPGVNYTVNNPDGWRGVGGDFNLMSGDVVYVNVRNSNNGTPSCISTCDMLFDFATPNRY